MSLANYVSIALMLALFGGVLFFLFRRRSRWTKLGAGTPAVLQPRAGSASESLPSTLKDESNPSWFGETPETSDREREEVRPAQAPAPRKSRSSPIVELHFVQEHKTAESSSTEPAPLIAAITEADVTESKTGWPASA